MSAAHDPDQVPQTGPPASHAEVAALTLRVAALEAQLTALTHPTLAPLPPAPAPPRVQDLASQTLPTQPPPPAEPLPPPPPSRSLEDRLGAQVFNFIGAAAIIIGASWALKLAIDHGLIGPVARILVGLAAGAALILWSERLRRRSVPAFSFSLKAVGSCILYLSLWAAFQLYHLLPANAAFAAMLLVTAWNAFMAWSQDAELLAAYALAGGLATPLLLSTGGDHETFLFLYLATLDAAAVLLLRWKPWRRLVLPAFLATVVFFIAWYARFFHPYASLPPRYDTTAPPAWDAQSLETALFVCLFFVLFALPSLRGWIKPCPLPLAEADPPLHPSTASPSISELAPRSRTSTSVLLDALLPLANAAFFSLALYSVFQDSGLHAALAWLMLALAALYLVLLRLQGTALSRAIHLALAVVFLTVAIPIKASGHTLTTAWFVEGLVLLWASTRIAPEDHDPASPTAILSPGSVLRLLSFAGYTLGFIALLLSPFWFAGWYRVGFFNATLGAALVAVGAFAGAAYFGLRAVLTATYPTARPIAWLPVAISDFLAIDVIAVLLTVREIVTSNTASLADQGLHRAFANPDFYTALVGLALLAASTYTLARLASRPVLAQLQSIAAGTSIAFNLAAVLTIVREIGALWSGPAALAAADSGVQRSLAVSAFLMLYGATLLALGFWRRSAFTRWQALTLLVFTILKVFLFDVSGLSQGYRVASFLSLGALLMAVSFAYQKDWLGLKTAVPTSDPSPTLHPRPDPAAPSPENPA